MVKMPTRLRKVLERKALEICRRRPFEGFDFKKGRPDEQRKLINLLTNEEQEALISAAHRKGMTPKELAGIVDRRGELPACHAGHK